MRFHHYTHSASKVTRVRTLQYSIPETVDQYVQMIQPTIRFGQPRPQRAFSFKVGTARKLEDVREDYHDLDKMAKIDGKFCNTTITPRCLREIYQIGDYNSSCHPRNKFGISGYLDQYAKYDDLTRFLRMFAPGQDREQNNFTYTLIHGGLATQNSSLDDLEANLDVQYGLSLSYLTQTVYYSTGGLGPLVPDLSEPVSPGTNEPYLDFLHYILSLPNEELPTTLTTSYGEDEQSVPASYTNAYVRLSSVIVLTNSLTVLAICSPSSVLGVSRFCSLPATVVLASTARRTMSRRSRISSRRFLVPVRL